MVNQPNANSIQPPNLARSEIDPLIRATVMIANIIWNARTTYVGIPVPLGKASVTPHISEMNVLPPRYWVKLPMKSFVPLLELVPNARLKPYSSQRTETSPIHEKLIIIMLRTPLTRFSPP